MLMWIRVRLAFCDVKGYNQQGRPRLPLEAVWYPINAPQGQEMHSHGSTASAKTHLKADLAIYGQELSACTWM